MIDPDLIPETNVLKNKLGITDQTLLDQAEADITWKGFSLNSKLLRDKAVYVRDALVLYNVNEAPEKDYFIKLIEDSINQY